MKKLKRFSAILLSGILILSMSATAAAAAGPSEKEEVVYAVLETDGSLKNIYVVNSFTGGGDILDYGDYSSVKMLNTTDRITLDGDKVTFSTSAKKAYYQGYLDGAALPWDISLKYYLDGKEYSADEIAGKSGSLEIRFKITRNDECAGTFYDDYALQASFTLDTNICFGIYAPDATVAAVGSDKQLTYTVLPGDGIDTTITAEVENFEMDAVSINGIHLNLTVEIDDSELRDMVSELIDAAAAIDDGASELSSGGADLQKGTSDLKDGVSDLNSGISSLDEGIATLQEGIISVQAALDSLNSSSGSLTSGSAQFKASLSSLQSALDSVSVPAGSLSALTEASDKISQALGSLYEGALTLQSGIGYAQYKALMETYGLDIDALTEGNTEAAEQLSTLIPSLQDTFDQLTSSAADIGYDQYKTLMAAYGVDMDSLKAGNAQAISELPAQIAALKTLQSIMPALPFQLETLISSLEQIQTLLTGNNAAIQGTETYLNTVSAKIKEYEEQLSTVKTMLGSLEQIQTLLAGNNAAIQGTESYLDAVAGKIPSLTEGLNSLTEQYAAFNASIAQLADSLSGMADNLLLLAAAVDQLVDAYGSIDSGIGVYTGGVAQIVSGYSLVLNGVASLADGSKELLGGSNDLYEGTLDLYDGVISLCDGADELASGTGEFREETSGMTEEIDDKIDQILDSIGGSMDDPVSFASSKNTNVDSVQFVLQTEAIKIPAAEEISEPEEKETTFWEKLLALFGL